MFSLSAFNVCSGLTQVVMFAWQALLSAEPFSSPRIFKMAASIKYIEYYIDLYEH